MVEILQVIVATALVVYTIKSLEDTIGDIRLSGRLKREPEEKEG